MNLVATVALVRDQTCDNVGHATVHRLADVEYTHTRIPYPFMPKQK